MTAWDGRPYVSGNNEAVEMLSFPPGDWDIGIHGFASYAWVTLQVSLR